MSDGIHVPVRPLWECIACDKDWPCAPARESLAKEYKDDLPALRTYLTILMGDAAADLPHVTVGELFERFIEWALALNRPLDAMTGCRDG